jgi:alkylation response protein AidB-like acyl-CoA dehydrogenase
MPLLRKLATLATVAEAARRYAKSNPDKASKYLDQAAQFVDKQTKGRYSGQISGVTHKAKSLVGIHETGAAGNGYTQGHDHSTFTRPTGSAPQPGQSYPGQPQPGQPYPGGPER